MSAASLSFAELLKSAVSEPGTISGAYNQFHSYSLGNQLLAWTQCLQRGLEPGPLATFPKWKDLGRYVKKGERAISLCQPVAVKRINDEGREDVFTRFIVKPHWFVLAQTEGQPYEERAIPEWDRQQALLQLGINEIPFSHLDGNVMGFARRRSIAISPLNPNPEKTRFHELAHVLLGHTAEGEHADGQATPRDLREAEAESVALLCCAALGLPGVEECRGYVQAWWGQGNPIPERSAQRILKVADQILRAGRAGVQ